MKALFLTLSILLSFFRIAAQQDTTSVLDTPVVFRPFTQIGVLYGQSWNDVSFSPRIAQGVYVGQRIAAVFRYTGQANLGIQVELAYDKRGWQETDTTTDAAYVRTVDYAELAFFSHLSLGKRSFRPFLLLGSFIGTPLSQTETIPANWPLNRSYYNSPLPNRWQYGLSGGLGLEVVLGGISLQVDGRYRTALGGYFAAGESSFTFSNGRGFAAQATIFVKL
ncbi:MAG: porin family protein [Saprospiraceae bacterium]